MDDTTAQVVDPGGYGIPEIGISVQEGDRTARQRRATIPEKLLSILARLNEVSDFLWLYAGPQAHLELVELRAVGSSSLALHDFNQATNIPVEVRIEAGVLNNPFDSATDLRGSVAGEVELD